MVRALRVRALSPRSPSPTGVRACCLLVAAYTALRAPPVRNTYIKRLPALPLNHFVRSSQAACPAVPLLLSSQSLFIHFE